MSTPLRDMTEGAVHGAGPVRADGAGAAARAHRLLAGMLDDFLIDDEARLDERSRLALAHVIAAQAARIEGELRQATARLLVARGQPELALVLTERARLLYPALRERRLLTRGPFGAEMVDRVRLALLAEALPIPAPEVEDRPSLLARLSEHRDPTIATAARALLAAEARRRDPGEEAPRNDLSAESQHQLLWLAAAVLRRAHLPAEADIAHAFDRALTEAVQRLLAAHDEGERLEAAAMRLAVALAPAATELGELVSEALADRRAALAVALLAPPLGLEFDTMRALMLDAGSDGLWHALRAIGLARPEIAAIGLALCEADPRRDVEAFADRLDALVALSPNAARLALAPFKLHPDLRQALVALEQGAA